MQIYAQFINIFVQSIDHVLNYDLHQMFDIVVLSFMSTKFQKDIYQIVKCTVKSQLSRLVNMTMQLYKRFVL